MTTPTAQTLGVQAESAQAERDRLAVAVPVDFRALFESLPVSDPDRHDLDPLDDAFAHLAPGYPQAEVA